MIREVAVIKGCVQFYLPAPNRHHSMLEWMDRSVFEQGFIDDAGKFLTRTEAAKVALESGQVKELAVPPELYSEDLW